jgi:hypothetical protein
LVGRAVLFSCFTDVKSERKVAVAWDVFDCQFLRLG